MLVFIDDSGEPGFKLNKGSTSHFVIAMVIFDDELESEKTAITIKELKRSLRFGEEVEFRFFKTSRDVKVKFFKAIAGYKFSVRSLVVDKTIIKSKELKKNKDKFYSYFIKEALKHSPGIKGAKVKIDGSGDRVFRRNFLTYLRRELNTEQRQIMQNCKLVDSKANVLVQMADMVAESINRSYSDKEDAAAYKKIIKNHIEDEWNFK